MDNFKHSFLCRFAVVTELPRLLCHQAADVQRVLGLYVQQFLPSHLVADNEQKERLQLTLLQESRECQQSLLGESKQSTPNRQLLTLSIRSDCSEEIIDIYDGTLTTTLPSFDQVLSYEDLLARLHSRTSQPFNPRPTWSLPFSILIASLRAFLVNDMSLNTVRVLSNFTYRLIPSSTMIHPIALPDDHETTTYLLQNSQTELSYEVNSIPLHSSAPKTIVARSLDFSPDTAFMPCARLQEVGPPGFDDTCLHFQPPRHANLRPRRFYINPAMEGHDHWIDAEWISDVNVVVQQRDYWKEIVGSHFSRCAVDLSEMEMEWNRVRRSIKSFLLQRRRWFDLRRRVEALRKEWYRLADRVDLDGLQIPKMSDEKVVLYLHGGGYCVMSTKTHRGLTSTISRKCNARVFAINYRRTPEYAFPAALIDATSAYLHLIQHPDAIRQTQSFSEWSKAHALHTKLPHPCVIAGHAPFLPIRPHNIIVMGDSAGGNLALSLMLHLRDQGYPATGGCVLISPWLDLSCSLPSWDRNHPHDFIPRLDINQEENIISAFTGWRHDLMMHPLVSPLYGDLSDLPPILVQVGEVEYLCDDSILLSHKYKTSFGHQKRLKNEPPGFRLEVYQDMVHVWHFFDMIPHANLAFDRIAQFTHECFNAGDNSEIQPGAVPTDDLESVADFNTMVDVEAGYGDKMDMIHGNDFAALLPVIQTKAVFEALYVMYDGQIGSIEGNLSLDGRFKMQPVRFSMS